MQRLPDTVKSDSKDKISCLKWTIYNDRWKVCKNCRTDTDNLNIVVYRYRNNLHRKENQIDSNLTKYQSLLAKWVG